MTDSDTIENSVIYQEGSNIGINTTTPTTKLQINASTIGSNDMLGFSTLDGTYNPKMKIGHVTSTSGQYMNFDSDYNASLGYGNWVFSHGKIGIGTNSPARNISMIGLADMFMRIHSTGKAATAGIEIGNDSVF